MSPGFECQKHAMNLTSFGTPRQASETRADNLETLIFRLMHYSQIIIDIQDLID